MNMIRNRLGTTNALVAIIVLALVAAVLIAKASFFFKDAVLPFTDYASNDILVTWAKHFGLWHGNYSRVGFYHPGPFFFQLMAWSELAFYDFLPIFHSPFAAQVFATLFFSALAIALVAALFHRLTGSVSLALLGMACFCIVMLMAKAYSFTAPWPPYLYVAAATVLIVGLYGVLLLGWRWLPWLIIGASALVHGHASFIGLVPVILFVTLAGAALGWWRGALPKLPSVLPPRSTALISVLLLLAFLAPIVLQTLLHWPGELPKYFSFAGHREPNPVKDVVRYVVDFMPLWGIVLPAAGITAWWVRRSDRFPAMLVAALVFAAGLVAAVFYARKGVDGFEYRYLEYWFVPFYAMLAASTLTLLVERAQGPYRAVTSLLAVLALAGVAYMGSKSWELLQTPASAPLAPYEQARKQIEALSLHGEPVPIGVDRTGGWDASWSDAITLLAHTNRAEAGEPRLCIAAESFHILFHEKFRCADPARLPRVLISSKFYPDLKQIFATETARYYIADNSLKAVANRTQPGAGDAALRSDAKLAAMEAAVVLRQRDQPRLDEATKAVAVHVVVENRGGLPLAGVGQYPINLAVVQLPGGKGGPQAMPRAELQRIPLPGVAPGSAVEMAIDIPAASFKDGAVVRLEIVQEGVAWFTYDYGLPPLDIGPLQACADNAQKLCLPTSAPR